MNMLYELNRVRGNRFLPLLLAPLFCFIDFSSSNLFYTPLQILPLTSWIALSSQSRSNSREGEGRIHIRRQRGFRR
uniref:Uncharacterized protein n=1 Tax=Cucumis melo TaxID=3656 RepID=A0A9I9ECS0_CUCME